MKKIFITICTFLLISLSAFCAIGSNFKNSLLSVDVKKTGESSYNIILNTQSPYAEPIKVIQKSDYDYYILLPETYSLIPESSSNSDIKNFSVQLFPYAGQSSENGYTKITILTVRPLAFSTSVNSIDKITPTKSDLDKIAKLNSLDNNTVNAIKKAEPKTISPKETVQAPQMQQQVPLKTANKAVQAPQAQSTSASAVSKQSKPVQIAQKQTVQSSPKTESKPVQIAPKQTVQQSSSQKAAKAAPQTQVESAPSNNAQLAKTSNPINVSRARKENIISYNQQDKKSEVQPQVQQTQNVKQEIKPAVQNPIKAKSKAQVVTKKASSNKTASTKPKAKTSAQSVQNKPTASVKTQTVPKKEPVAPQAVPEQRVAQVEIPKENVVQTPKENIVQKPQENVPQTLQSDNNQPISEEINNTQEEKPEETVIPAEEDYENAQALVEEINKEALKDEIIAKIKDKISNIDFHDKKTIGIISAIVLLFLMIVFRKRKKQPQYQNVPQSAYVESAPDIVEVQNEVSPNTYVEEEVVTQESPLEEESYIEEGIVEEPVQVDIENEVEEVEQAPIEEEIPETIEEVEQQDEEVSLDELDEADLDEIDNMEAQQKYQDEQEFEADSDIEIVEDTEENQIEEPIVEETPQVPENEAPKHQEPVVVQSQPAVQNPIKESPKVETQTHNEPEQESGAEVLSSVQIDANKGFCVTYYNNQLILIGYVGEDIFLIHKFRRGEISNAQIKFRLSDSNLNEDFYMVKVDNSKFLVKVTPNKMALELLV